MASVSISCPSCSATDGVVRNGKSNVSKITDSFNIICFTLI
ncbi:hypothetical protein NL302_28690, partial [Klebsiella pneumoniae]|nr:hypothetical protein [Klebsiella pneumoniae]